MPLIPVTIDAENLQIGDQLRYHYCGKFESVVRVSTVDITSHFMTTWPDCVNLQVDHPARNRIAVQYLSGEPVQVMREAKAPKIRRKSSNVLIRRSQGGTAPKSVLKSWLSTLKTANSSTDTKVTGRKAGPLVRKKRV